MTPDVQVKSPKPALHQDIDAYAQPGRRGAYSGKLKRWGSLGFRLVACGLRLLDIQIFKNFIDRRREWIAINVCEPAILRNKSFKP